MKKSHISLVLLGLASSPLVATHTKEHKAAKTHVKPATFHEGQAPEHTKKEHAEAYQHNNTAVGATHNARKVAKSVHGKIQKMPEHGKTKRDVVAQAKHMKQMIHVDLGKASALAKTAEQHFMEASKKSDKNASRKWSGAAGNAKTAHTIYWHKAEKLGTDLMQNLSKIFRETKKDVLKASNHAYKTTKKHVTHLIEQGEKQLMDSVRLSNEAVAHHKNDPHESK
jgi:hypothetical protein